MTQPALTRRQTDVLKGIGILLIVLHNFLHNVPPIIGENEFSFDPDVVRRFVAAVADSPTQWVSAGASFLGHYGVSLFVFLSTYGLTRRYAHGLPPYRTFLAARLAKVYVTFLVCVGLYLALWSLRHVVLENDEAVPWVSLVLKLTLISNVVPHQALAPVGPWWFIPFIFQVYAAYPLLLWVEGRWKTSGLVSLAAASVALEWSVNDALMDAGLNLNYLVLGHLPVLCLGVIAARVEAVRVPWWLVPLLLLAFGASNVQRELWLVSDVLAAMLLVILPFSIARTIGVPRAIGRVLAAYGTLSLPLFLVNGFLRTPFHALALSVDHWAWTIVCACASLLFSTLVAIGLHFADRRIRQLWSVAVR